MKKVLVLIVVIATLFNPVANASPSFSGNLDRLTLKDGVVRDSDRRFTKYPVNQGDWVNISGYGYCTIGYVDKVNHRAYTAAHCAPRMKNWERLIVKTPFTNELIGELFVRTKEYEANGKLHRSWKSDSTYIQLYPEVQAGENTYSGDTRIMPEDVEDGDEVCIYSVRLDKTSCRPVFSTFGPVIKMNAPRYKIDPPISVEGDSGGPGWIPGKGFVGTISVAGGSTLWLTSIDANDCMEDEPRDQTESEGFEPQVCEPGKEYSDQSPHNAHKFDTRFKPLNRESSSTISQSSTGTTRILPVIAGTILTLLTVIAGLMPHIPHLQKLLENFK